MLHFLVSFLFLIASVSATAATQIPLLEKEACEKNVDQGLIEKYQSQPYGYRGGGHLITVKYTGNIYSVIHFYTPGMNSDAVDEVLVKNKDCSVIEYTTIWAD